MFKHLAILSRVDDRCIDRDDIERKKRERERGREKEQEKQRELGMEDETR